MKNRQQKEGKMAFVIYRTDTTEIVSEKDYSYSGQIHKTEGHAKASLTRIKKKFAEGLAKKRPYGTFKFEGLGIHENGKTGRQARGELTGEMVEMKIVDSETYFNKIEAQEEVTNMMTGKKFKQSVNTPNFMSPACESYWSM
jgi:hypothetical protein|tara:strand:- start:1066 stop:1491 length:426 start_codon:yes stop_codon:yes gene_type:complete